MKKHYHPWLMASTGTMFYKCRRRNTRPSAHKWAKLRQPDPHKRMVLECHDTQCPDN